MCESMTQLGIGQPTDMAAGGREKSADDLREARVRVGARVRVRKCVLERAYSSVEHRCGC